MKIVHPNQYCRYPTKGNYLLVAWVQYCVDAMRRCRSVRGTVGLRSGQALVEVTLSLTLLTMLVGAAVDLGLAYKTHQTLVNATAEASSYLDLNPKVSGSDPITAANSIALQRFQYEQGTSIRNIATTLDLNANGVRDDQEEGFNIADWVQITEANNVQVSTMSTYNPSQAGECANRVAQPTAYESCYIVIRSRMIYRPFLLSPILGDQMNIRTTSVRRVVKGTTN